MKDILCFLILIGVYSYIGVNAYNYKGDIMAGNLEYPVNFDMDTVDKTIWKIAHNDDTGVNGLPGYRNGTNTESLFGLGPNKYSKKDFLNRTGNDLRNLYNDNGGYSLLNINEDTILNALLRAWGRDNPDAKMDNATFDRLNTIAKNLVANRASVFNPARYVKGNDSTNLTFSNSSAVNDLLNNLQKNWDKPEVRAYAQKALGIDPNQARIGLADLYASNTWSPSGLAVNLPGPASSNNEDNTQKYNEINQQFQPILSQVTQNDINAAEDARRLAAQQEMEREVNREFERDKLRTKAAHNLAPIEDMQTYWELINNGIINENEFEEVFKMPVKPLPNPYGEWNHKGKLSKEAIENAKRWG